MELYSLDSNFNRVDLVEKYTSAIWTERYSTYGDFELVFTEQEYAKQDFLNEGSYLGLKGTLDVGLIDKQVFKDGKVTLSGKDLGYFLKNRWYVLRNSNDSNSSGKVRVDTPERMCAWMLYWYVGPGVATFGPAMGIQDYANEMILNLDSGYTVGGGYIYPDVSGNRINHQIPIPSNFLDMVTNICEPNGVGWRFYPEPDGTADYPLYFRTYRGLDRSKGQTVNTPVVLSQNDGGIKDVEEVHINADTITAVHTYAPKLRPENYGYDPQDVVGFATAPGTSGYTKFDRRTAIVTFDDMTPDDYHWFTSSTVNGMVEAKKVLDQRAKDIIANSTHVRLLNGEVVMSSQYKFGEDYGMGDIITLKGAHGAYQNARVIEYIRTHDSTGHKEYPTITVI